MTTATLLWHYDDKAYDSHALSRVLLYCRLSLYESKIAAAVCDAYIVIKTIFYTHYIIIVPDPFPAVWEITEWISRPAGAKRFAGEKKNLT